MIVLYILLAIVLLLTLVLIHELGHYIVGRALKFKITEFSIGFGKAIFSRTNKRGEKISLRLFPLGGYCAFAGEEGEDGEKVDPKDCFTAQAPWKRILVFLAGVGANFLTAIVFSLVLLCTIGYDIPKVDGYISSQEMSEEFLSYSYSSSLDSSAFSLQEGDVIFYVEGVKIDFAYSQTYSDLVTAKLSEVSSAVSSGEDFNDLFAVVNFTVRRDGEMIDVCAPIYQVTYYKTDSDGNYVYDGDEKVVVTAYMVSFDCSAYVYSFWEGLGRCVQFAFGLAWVVLKSLWQLVTFQLAISEIGGTVTAITQIATYAQQSMSTILVLIPLLSANLAVFNILPIPALDGAHVVFTLIEWIRGKPINRDLENKIHTVGLIVLLVFVVVVDLLHFIL